MTSALTFRIDQQDFSCSSDTILSDGFVVQSVPKPYRVTWQTELAPLDLIKQQLEKNPKNLLLIDANVLALYGKQLNIAPERVFTVTATEAFKTLDGVTAVLDFLQQNHFTKGEQLVVVGGGITEDVGAFVGAVYKRGIPWVYIPTTLLSMADSCIGGKTGINYRGAKNQLALFSAPASVIIHPAFLDTLEPDAIYSGLGEILKLCITGGTYFVDLFGQNVKDGHVVSAAAFRKLIMAALTVKKAIVEVDEFELNHRRSLNYGHTLGHAIEVLSDYKIPHGQAVVIGMALVNQMAHRQGMLSAAELQTLNQLCYGLMDGNVMAKLADIRLDSIIALIQKDKKTVGQMTSFVLMQSVGDTRFVKLSLNDELLVSIQDAWQRVLARA